MYNLNEEGVVVHVWRVASWLSLLCVVTFPRSVSSSVSGVLADPGGAAVAGASCALTDQATGAVLTASSSVDGRFTFPTVLAGTCTLNVKLTGSKTLEVKDIVVTSREIRTLGNLTLQLGEVRESVSVAAEAAALQLASAERSGILTGSQVNQIALQGRDVMALLQTIPGIVDSTATRETTSNTAGAGIFREPLV